MGAQAEGAARARAPGSGRWSTAAWRVPRVPGPQEERWLGREVPWGGGTGLGAGGRGAPGWLSALRGGAAAGSSQPRGRRAGARRAPGPAAVVAGELGNGCGRGGAERRGSGPPAVPHVPQSSCLVWNVSAAAVVRHYGVSC